MALTLLEEDTPYSPNNYALEVCAGLAAACALNGIDSVPAAWVEIVERELETDPYTVSRRSLHDTAQGLYQALLNEIERSKARIAELEQLCD